MDTVSELIKQYGPAAWENIAKPIWALAVRQALIDGLTMFVWALLLLVGSAIALFVAERVRRTSKKDHYGGYSDGEMIVMVALYILTVLGAIAFAILLTNGIQWVLNPEFQALKYLIGTVKK